jgi:DUF438 domain-containing protein
MVDSKILDSILQNLVEPIVFIDSNHTISYMNKKGIEQYKDRGGAGLIGKSVFDCHNEHSIRVILELFECLKNGEEECLESENGSKKSFMRAVRNKGGNLIGYYERYEK